MKYKLLLPVVALCLFLLTPLTSMAAPAHSAIPSSVKTVKSAIREASTCSNGGSSTCWKISTGTIQHAAASPATTIRPDIGQAPSCPNNGYTYIDYNYGASTTCFGGDGYMGIGPNLFNVVALWSGVNCGWVRVYDNTGGYYHTFNSETNNAPILFPNKITQIDIQGQNCVGVAP